MKYTTWSAHVTCRPSLMRDARYYLIVLLNTQAIFFSRSNRSHHKNHSENQKYFICNFQQHLPATSLHSRRSDIDIFRSVIPTFEYPRHRSQPLCFQTILYAGLVPKCCPPTTVSNKERDENHIFRSVVPTFQYPLHRSQPLCFQTILYAGLVPKCCPPMTVSYKERNENNREPSPGGCWWVIKHFPPKMLQEPLCCSCSMRPSIVMKKDNT